MRLRVLATAVAASALLIAGCSSDSGGSGGDSESITIATTNFSETTLLANMYQQILESKGVSASIKELTTREVIIPALESGEIQATPEYLGSFTEFINRQVNGPDAPQLATGDAAATYEAAKPLAEQQGIALLTPSPAQDQNAFAVTSEFAKANNLKTLSDLAAYSQTNPVNLGGPPECPQRPFCQPGLEETYGMKIASFTPLDAGGPLTVQALTQGKINVGLVFSSSGSITSNDLVVLTDDKQLQTAENVTPALNSAAASDTVVAALDAVSAALTTEELQQMNQQIEVDRANPRKVAEEFLTSKGLVD
ncbi:MAG: ABC transporter substrate-binding protein [Actinobacteria bacterium]|nr:ABC transporter substrate-binding protein [Actinomycetota bacterium]MCB9411352.1 ABC transporter substrate-binding protein [Actinomycetota bacterium]